MATRDVMYRSIETKKFKSKINWTFVYIIMIVLVGFMALPLIYTLVSAFKPINELWLYPPRFFVKQPTIKNFSDLLTNLDSSSVPFTRYIFNSVFTTVVTVAGTTILSSMAAYALEKFELPGSKILFSVIIAALMFSPQVTQIPNFLIINALHLSDTYWAIIIPKLAVPLNLFLMKQFISQMPTPLIEAARIEGAREMGIFWKIVMPLCAPAWATVIVFSFIANWNDYFSVLIFIHDQSMQTLPLALQLIAGGTGQAARSGAVAAATLVVTLPTILVFIIMQSKVLKTMAHAGIKG